MLSNLVLFLTTIRLYFILKRYLNFKLAIVPLAGAAAAVLWKRACSPWSDAQYHKKKKIHFLSTLFIPGLQ